MNDKLPPQDRTLHRGRWTGVAIVILVVMLGARFGVPLYRQQQTIAGLADRCWMRTFDEPTWIPTWVNINWKRALSGRIDINATGEKITDQDLARLLELRHLHSLWLTRTLITDEGLALLADAPSLRILGLGETRITDAGLPRLADLKKLTALSLHKTAISDAGLVHLKGLTQLDYLSLTDTGITDAGLVHLFGLTQLKDLRLDRTRVTPEGISRLKAALPGIRLEL